MPRRRVDRPPGTNLHVPGYADDIIGGGFTEADVAADMQIDQFAGHPDDIAYDMMQDQFSGRPTKGSRPGGTRLFVPGYLDDLTQDRVDTGELGIAPIVIAGAAKLAGGLFKKGSGSKAAGDVPRVVESANNGNLIAVAFLDTRRTFGISKERAQWSAGYSKVDPIILAQYNQYRSKILATIPQSAQAGPDQATSYALAHNLTIDQITPPKPIGAPNVPGLPSRPPNVLPPILQPGGGSPALPPYVPPAGGGGGGMMPVPMQPPIDAGGDGTSTSPPVQPEQPGLMTMFSGAGSGKMAMMLAVGLVALSMFGGKGKRR